MSSILSSYPLFNAKCISLCVGAFVAQGVGPAEYLCAHNVISSMSVMAMGKSSHDRVVVDGAHGLGIIDFCFRIQLRCTHE
jgi:hypothetical protein